MAARRRRASAAVASSMTFRAPDVPFVSTVTGEVERRPRSPSPTTGSTTCSPRCASADAVAILLAAGIDQFLEIGPQPTLLGTIGRILGSDRRRSTRRCGRGDRDDDPQMADALGSLWTAGLRAVDWEAVDGGGLAKVDLPTYPFQRQRYWVERRHHPAGRRARPESGSTRWCTSASTRRRWPGGLRVRVRRREDPSYLADHRVFDARSCRRRATSRSRWPPAGTPSGSARSRSTKSRWHEMLVLHESRAVRLHVVLGEVVGRHGPASRVQPRARRPLAPHASGVVELAPARPPPTGSTPSRTPGVAVRAGRPATSASATGASTTGAEFRTMPGSCVGSVVGRPAVSTLSEREATRTRPPTPCIRPSSTVASSCSRRPLLEHGTDDVLPARRHRVLPASMPPAPSDVRATVRGRVAGRPHRRALGRHRARGPRRHAGGGDVTARAAPRRPSGRGGAGPRRSGYGYDDCPLRAELDPSAGVDAGHGGAGRLARPRR